MVAWTSVFAFLCMQTCVCVHACACTYVSMHCVHMCWEEQGDGVNSCAKARGTFGIEGQPSEGSEGRWRWRRLRALGLLGLSGDAG